MGYNYEKIVGQFANQMLRFMPGHIPEDFQEVLKTLYTYLKNNVQPMMNKTVMTDLLNDFIVKNCSDWVLNMNPHINVNVNITKDVMIARQIVDALDSSP